MAILQLCLNILVTLNYQQRNINEKYKLSNSFLSIHQSKQAYINNKINAISTMFICIISIKEKSKKKKNRRGEEGGLGHFLINIFLFIICYLFIDANS